MSLDKNLTNRIFRIAIQAESAVIILINQQASAFGTDVSGQFFVFRIGPHKRACVVRNLIGTYRMVLAIRSGLTRN